MDYSMSDLVLSNLTINGRPIGVFDVQPDPPTPTFPVVLMPDGKYWTSVDLDVDDGQGEIFKYDNVTANGYNFGTQYYYSHTAAKRVADSIPGYHLPTRQEWVTMINYISNDTSIASIKLRSTYGWSLNNGTDDYGFTILPVGNMYHSYTGSIDDLEEKGARTCYWCYDERAVTERHDCVRININSISFSDEWSLPSYNFCFKVRLIKD